jgi:hypothetical protein
MIELYDATGKSGKSEAGGDLGIFEKLSDRAKIFRSNWLITNDREATLTR